MQPTMVLLFQGKGMAQQSTTHLAVVGGHKVVVALHRHQAEAAAGVAPPLAHVAACDGVVVAAVEGDDGDAERLALRVPAGGQGLGAGAAGMP